MAEYTFDSPVHLVKHLYAGENTPTGICGRPSSLFGWYTKAKKFYDTTLCKSCKSKLTKEQIEEMYTDILRYSEDERKNAVLAVGGNFTLKLDGKILGKVTVDE